MMTDEDLGEREKARTKGAEVHKWLRERQAAVCGAGGVQVWACGGCKKKLRRW